jgi:hypothetical protein
MNMHVSTSSASTASKPSSRKSVKPAAGVMQVTSIETMGQVASGYAVAGAQKLEWFYRPGGFFRVREQQRDIPDCWMNIDPPVGARRAVLAALRAARLGRPLAPSR